MADTALSQKKAEKEPSLYELLGVEKTATGK